MDNEKRSSSKGNQGSGDKGQDRRADSNADGREMMNSDFDTLPPADDGLYPSVLEEMERKLLKRAREVDGLDEEIALLRVKLATALAQEPKNTELLLKGLAVLIRAVATKARYSSKAE